MNNHNFQSIDKASSFLKHQLEMAITQQIESHNRAILILPGGNSIKLFYPCLINLNILWNRVTIGLSDERCVPLKHEMSNERQLRQYMLNFIPKCNYCPLNKEFLLKIRTTPPITVLSMGNDGHVASLFPEESKYWKNAGIGIYKTKYQNPIRVSLTEDALLTSSKIYLLATGKEKNKFLNKEKSLPSSLNSIYNKATWIKC